jgi:hypothetical protein
MFLLLGRNAWIPAAVAGAALLIFGVLAGRPVVTLIGAGLLVLAGVRALAQRRSR